MSSGVTIPAGANDSGNNSSCNSGFIRLRSRIARLDFAPFQRCVWIWLGASGYKHMRSLGRRSCRGRRYASGPDFVVQIDVESGVTIAVQVRHWKSPLSRRAVDELRGYMQRHGLSAGIIVCSSTISRSARNAAQEYPGRPIRLVGIDRFVASMATLGLGLMDWPLRQTIDEAFFRVVHELSLGPTRPHEAVRSSPRPAQSLASAALVDDAPWLNSDRWLYLLVLVAVGLTIWVLVGWQR